MATDTLIGLDALIDSQTEILILGSMPGGLSLQKQQYYGNPRNHFWPIMAEILEVSMPDGYVERIALLQKHGIGLWDVIHSCKRKGSLDATITDAVPNDFKALFMQYPSIRVVGLNGAKAYQTFQKQVGFDFFPDIQFMKLPSTSPIPGKNVKSFAGKVLEWQKLFEISY